MYLDSNGDGVHTPADDLNANGPVVSAPATASGTENSTLTVFVTASDPDGDRILSLTADLSELPAARPCPVSSPCSAVFVAAAGNTSGTLTWTPAGGDARPTPYNVTFTASNALSGSATTAITVAGAGSAPNLVGNPSFESSMEGWGASGAAVVQRVSGGLDGGFSAEVLGTGAPTAKFGLNDTPNWVAATSTARARYRFSAWVRSASANGRAQLRVREYLGAVLRGTTYSGFVALSPSWRLVTVDHTVQAAGSTLDLQVFDAPVVAGETFQVDRASIQVVEGPPAVTAPASASGTENSLLTVSITASDRDGDPITNLVADLSALPAANDAIFTAGAGNTSGILTWTPAGGNARSAPYNVTFTASNALSGSATTAITIVGAGLGPNLVGNPSFESSTTGWRENGPAAVQQVAGGFDGGFSVEARSTSSTKTKFGVNDSPNWVRTTPASGTRYHFAAWVRSATALGRAQLQVREYVGADLRGAVTGGAVVLSPTWQLVAIDYVAQATGSTLDFQIHDVPVAVGEAFQVDNVSIQAAMGGSAARAIETASTARGSFDIVVAPNPFNPETTLAFTTSQEGPIRLRIFDAAGRVVRLLLNERNAPAGRHAVRFDGRGSNGQGLSSGVYFYRIEAADGATSGRLVLMR